MAAKRILISADDSTYYDLPSPGGSMSESADNADDTLLGQTFASSQPTLANWSISANARYRGYAGYQFKLLQMGTATTAAGEACSLVSGKTYQIDATSKRIWDRSADVTVYDNATPVADADIESIDYLFGKVTFDAAYTVVGAITVDVEYFPTSTFAGAKTYTLGMQAQTRDDTDAETAQGNGGYRVYTPGLRTVSLSIDGIYKAASGWRTKLREEIIIEINPDGEGKSVARGFFKLSGDDRSGDVGANEVESLNFELTVPDANIVPFSWEHASDTKIGDAIKILLAAWQDETMPYVKYLPDGTTGFKGQGVVTDLSLSGDTDGLNEFTVMIQGSDNLTSV